MKELIWLLPICLTVALTLGACRADTLPTILSESTKSFAKIVIGIVLICVGLQVILMLIPPLS